MLSSVSNTQLVDSLKIKLILLCFIKDQILQILGKNIQEIYVFKIVLHCQKLIMVFVKCPCVSLQEPTCLISTTGINLKSLNRHCFQLEEAPPIVLEICSAWVQPLNHSPNPKMYLTYPNCLLHSQPLMLPWSLYQRCYNLLHPSWHLSFHCNEARCIKICHSKTGQWWDQNQRQQIQKI